MDRRQSGMLSCLQRLECNLLVCPMHGKRRRCKGLLRFDALTTYLPLSIRLHYAAALLFVPAVRRVPAAGVASAWRGAR